jgi:hypothetical protein
MKKSFAPTVIALILVTSLLSAGEKIRLVSISTNESTTESVVPELAKIVVLCAADEEENFKQEWGRYVAHHELRGAELQKTISWVSDEAAMHRSMKMQVDDDKGRDRTWKEERRKMMSEIARRAMNPLR